MKTFEDLANEYNRVAKKYERTEGVGRPTPADEAFSDIMHLLLLNFQLTATLYKKMGGDHPEGLCAHDVRDGGAILKRLI